MNIYLISLFPELIQQATSFGVLGRAIKQQQLTLKCFNPRDYTEDKHRTVDDRPYGGGPGMLMKDEPLYKAIMAAKEKAGNKVKVVYLSPQGQPLNQQLLVNTAATANDLILIAGRYEGIDERFIEKYVTEMYSLGDFILTGGELAVMAIIDSVVRLIPGTLGNSDSTKGESFEKGLLEHGHYTRPAIFEGLEVPTVLLSGHHKKIEQYRAMESKSLTEKYRPDLLQE